MRVSQVITREVAYWVLEEVLGPLCSCAVLGATVNERSLGEGLCWVRQDMQMPSTSEHCHWQEILRETSAVNMAGFNFLFNFRQVDFKY